MSAMFDSSSRILITGGAGSSSHFIEAFSNSVIQGVVAGSIFSLTRETPSTIREFCEFNGIRMRQP